MNLACAKFGLVSFWFDQVSLVDFVAVCLCVLAFTSSVLAESSSSATHAEHLVAVRAHLSGTCCGLSWLVVCLVFSSICAQTLIFGVWSVVHTIPSSRSHSSAPSTRKAVELELSTHRCWEILLFFPCVDIDIGFQIRRSGWFFAQRLIAATWIKFPNFV